MFQIETALLKFDDMSESSDKTSVVKRYITNMGQYPKLMIIQKTVSFTGKFVNA